MQGSGLRDSFRIMQEPKIITSPNGDTDKTQSSQTSQAGAENTPLYLTSTIGLLRGIIDYCRQRDIPIAPVLAEAQLSESDLSDIDNRIPSERYHHALLKAAELSGDPDFGVHFGEAVKPGHYGVVGLVAMSCEKASELLQLHIRYQSLVGDDTSVEYQVTDDRIELRTFPKLECMHNSRLRQESTFSSWLTLARWITGLDNHYPLRVDFTHPKPENTDEQHRVFGPTISWEQDVTRVVFDRAVAETPLPQANPALRKQLESQAEEQLIAAGGAQFNPLLQQVQSLIAKSLADGTPDIDNIAAALNLSTRALQRKLAELSTSFSDMLDSTRKELAMSYIGQPHISLTEVAFLLGFSEQSAFNRAFKRWLGATPNTYRKATKAS